MSDTVSFKVFMTSVNDPIDAGPQIRRFVMKKDVATDFEKLTDKLKILFSEVLQWFLYVISWKDAEGDYVIIKSTEELQLALSEMSEQDTCKLYICERCKVGCSTSDRKGSAAKKKRPQTVHSTVTCAECRKMVVGFRYKCIQCANYDLCSDCEAKGLHPEHSMIRTAADIAWKSAFERCLAFHMMIK